MTETERSLLDAVLENPDDDLPRLVYADYLDENGDPNRAEFIRAQVAMSQMENEDGYHTDEYRQAVFSIKNVSSSSSFKQWIECTGLDICHADNIYYDIHGDRIRVRDMKSYNHYHFQRGFLETIIAYEEWCLKYWKSITLNPIKKIEFQPHISTHDYIAFKHEKNEAWSLDYRTGPYNNKKTLNANFSNRRDTFHWLVDYHEKQRIESEERALEMRTQAIVDLRRQIETEQVWNTYRGPLDDITLGNLIDHMHGRPPRPASRPGGPEHDRRE